MTGVRRVLDNAAHRALAAGPPTKAQEARGFAAWLGCVAVALGLAGLAEWLDRS
jgi:hypothetical protein